MKNLAKGDFIVIKIGERLAHAKVVSHVPEKKRINVFTQGTLKWLDETVFVRMGEKGASLKAGEFISGGVTSEIPPHVIDKGVEQLANAIDSAAIKNLEAGQKVLTHEETKVLILTETDEMFLAPFRKGKTGKTLTIEQVSDAVGKSTPATKHAIERLHGLGYLDLINADLQEYALSIRGLKHAPGAAKKKSDIPKLKTDSSGEVTLSKKERVSVLLKNPDLTIKQISEMTGAAQSYIRGIRERSAKKMDVPDEGTIKRKVYDELRAGGTLVDVAKRSRVTISYVYQIRQQMLSAKII